MQHVYISTNFVIFGFFPTLFQFKFLEKRIDQILNSHYRLADYYV